LERGCTADAEGVAVQGRWVLHQVVAVEEQRQTQKAPQALILRVALEEILD
jgi:hypothetical protein